MRQTSLDMIHKLAQKDGRVVFMGSDLGAGTLDKMRKEFPNRYFMEGIAEAAFVGMAAGLAMEGFVPYLNTIAPFFTRRALEQICIDVALHKLPVRLIASGGGVVYAPLGPTHLAFEDIALMRAIPNMTVVAVCDKEEMARLMEESLNWPGPIYIRLAKGGDKVISRAELGFEIGKAITLREAGEITILATGVMSQRALEIPNARVIHLHTIKPLDKEAVLNAAKTSKLLVSLEEHSLIGGLGSAIAELLADEGIAVPLLRLGIGDKFPHEYGSQESLLESLGLGIENIQKRIQAKFLCLN